MNIEKIIEKFGPPPQWTPDTQGTEMNQITKYVELFRDVNSVKKVCNCRIHKGDTLYQINAYLPNGTPIVILEDRYGYHISIGDYDPEYAPPAVDEGEAARMILEALSL